MRIPDALAQAEYRLVGHSRYSRPILDSVSGMSGKEDNYTMLPTGVHHFEPSNAFLTFGLFQPGSRYIAIRLVVSTLILTYLTTRTFGLSL